MKSTGIIREVDQLGRVVLPSELRKSLDIQEKDPLNIMLDGDRIVMRKTADHCVFCGARNDLTPFEGKAVCAECIRQLKLEIE